MKKLITFGCSFTDYSWPTWSDIIALDRDCEYENWAIGGGGNQQIARRALYRITRGMEDTDWVMIQWTSAVREDRFKINRWIAEGSVALSPTYRGDFVEKYWDWNNDIINTAHSRLTTEQLLGSRLKYQMAMTWQDPMGEGITGTDSKLLDYWSQQLPKLDELPTETQSFNGTNSRDGHPDPQWWLHWCETKIYPRFGWQMKSSTKQQVSALQNYLQRKIYQGCSQSALQQEASEWCRKANWPTNKVKPGSDTLTPGKGSDVLM